MVEKLKNILSVFEWSYETKPRLFALGMVIGSSITYLVYKEKDDSYLYTISKQRAEIERLETAKEEAQKDCISKIKEVREFLKEVAE